MAQRTYEIVNKLGLHARPAALFVQLTQQYQVNLAVQKEGEERSVNGKSIMGLLTLAAAQGSKLIVTTEGERSEELLDKIAELLQNKFYED